MSNYAMLLGVKITTIHNFFSMIEVKYTLVSLNLVAVSPPQASPNSSTSKQTSPVNPIPYLTRPMQPIPKVVEIDRASGGLVDHAFTRSSASK